MTENTKIENLAYLENGVEVEVLQRTEHGVIVCRLYSSDSEDEEPYAGDPQLVGRVFDTPPTERKAERVQELEERKLQLLRDVDEKQRELNGLEVGEKRLAALAAKDAALGRVCNFIDGKITHYLLSEWNGYKILEAAADGSLPYLSEYGREEGTKLLTLFGQSGGTFAWKLNRYSDGSGSAITCEPFGSLEAAKARLQEAIDDYGTVSGSDRQRLITAAQEHGLNIPPDLAREVAQGEVAAAQKGVAVRRETLAQTEAELQATKDKWAWALMEEP